MCLIWFILPPCETRYPENKPKLVDILNSTGKPPSVAKYINSDPTTFLDYVAELWKLYRAKSRNPKKELSTWFLNMLPYTSKPDAVI